MIVSTLLGLASLGLMLRTLARLRQTRFEIGTFAGLAQEFEAIDVDAPSTTSGMSSRLDRKADLLLAA